MQFTSSRFKRLVYFCLSAVLLLSSYVHSNVGINGGQESFTFLNWNAWELGAVNNYPHAEVRNLLLAYKPDVLALQEVRSCSDTKGFYALMPPNDYFNYNGMWCADNKAYPGKGKGSAGTYGVALASNFPTRSDKVFREINGRTVMGAKYEIMGEIVWVWSAHTAFKSEAGNHTRLSDFQSIVSFINQHAGTNAPVILGGDFNADRDNVRATYGQDPEEGDMDVLYNAGFVDVVRAVFPNAKKDPLLTWYNERLDYVFTRNLPADWKVGNVEVLDNPWCTLNKNNESSGINCPVNRVIDHSPVLVSFFKTNVSDALDIEEQQNEISGQFRVYGDGLLLQQSHEFAPSLTNNNDALQTSVAEAGQVTHMEKRIQRGGTLSFWWKTRLNQSGSVQFYIDGEQQSLLTGNSDWEKIELSIPTQSDSQEALLTWTFNAGSQPAADAAAWLDTVQYYGLQQNSILPSPQRAAEAAIDVKAKKLSAGNTNTGFYITETEAYLDGEALRSRTLNNNETATMSFNIRGAGSFFLTARTSTQKLSNNQGDALSVYVDGQRVKQVSGYTNWQTYEMPVFGEGNHQIIVEYKKDATGSEGEDAVWIDNVNFAPYVHIKDKYYGQLSDLAMYWTGYGNDCTKANYDDCKNMMLISQNSYPGPYAASKWKVIPTEYENVYYVEEFWADNTSHGGRMYWTSGGDDCQKAGYDGCKNLMLNGARDQALGRNALWYFRWDENLQGYAIEDRDSCRSEASCGSNGSGKERRVHWTGGGNDCQDGYQNCKNLMLINQSQHPGIYQGSVWEVYPSLD